MIKLVRKQKLQTMDELFVYCLLKLKFVNKDIYVNAPLAMNECILICHRRLRSFLKVYITFFQVVSGLPSVLHFTEFPTAFRNKTQQLNALVSFGFSRNAIFSCTIFESFDFIDRLYFDTIYPAIVALVFVVLYHVHVKIATKNKNLSKTAIVEKAVSIRSTYLQIFLVFTYLIFPSLVVTVFETFSCYDVDPDDVDDGDDRFLRVDFRISCHSSRYRFANAWAISMIFVYVVGIPLFYFYLLYPYRSAIKLRGPNYLLLDKKSLTEQQHNLFAIRILFDSYKPHYWYWELVETGFRMSLTGFLVLGAYAGDNAQIVLGFCVAVLFVKLYEACEPFLDGVSQSSKVISLWEICAIFFLLILMKDDFLNEFSTTILLYALLAIVLANMLHGLFLIIRLFIKETSAANLEALEERNSTISTSRSNTLDGTVDATSVIFSPFEIDKDFTRKEVQL